MHSEHIRDQNTGGKTVKASTRAKNKYNAKTYDRLNIVLMKGGKANLEDHISTHHAGTSVNAFVVAAIREKMDSDMKKGG